MKRQRGFTLVELLISLALAGMIVAGAIQLHASFNVQSHRQQEIADIQQTLRVSMLVIERAIRTAGAGFGNLKFVETSSAGSCGGGPINHYAFEWSNSNTYQDPITTYYTAGNADTDPDWFRIVATDQSGALLTSGDNGSNLQIILGDPSNFNDGDLFQVVTPTGICTREVSKGGVHGGSTGTRYVQHNPAQSIRCFNPVPSQDSCIGQCSATTPCPVRHVAAGGTVYRIDQSDPKTPRLVMRAAPFGTAQNNTSYPWTVIAENIEDMQIALILKDGTQCGSSTANDSDNPTICDFSKIVAVRVTLVGRGSSPIQGVSSNLVGGYEDEASSAKTDGYLRRSLTSEIQLRNQTPS